MDKYSGNGSQKIYFSMIIPFYNCEKYLAQCLDSCLDQDLSPEEYEIICVDDGSTDQSPKILDEYASKHGNIVAIHKENGGVSTARNAGIEVAKGKYIWFIDGDDLVQDHILLQLKQAVEEKKSRYFHFLKYDFQEELTEEEKELKKKKALRPNARPLAGFITSKLYERKAILDAGIGFVPGIKVGQDELFNFEFQKIYGEPEEIELVAYLYRVNTQSVTHGGQEVQRTRKRTDAISKQILFLYDEQKNESGELRNKTIDFMFRRRCLYFEYCVTCLPFREFVSELKRAKKVGIFSINRLAKEAKIEKWEKRVVWLIIKNRWKYLYHEKIAVGVERLFHPIRTIKNVKKRRNGQ